MAVRAKPCNCSDCAGQASACDCGTACGLACRKKEGSAALCGFAEFTSPSDPPKRYRTRKWIGDMFTFIDVSNNNCNTKLATSDYIYDSTCTYNKDTCALTSAHAGAYVERDAGGGIIVSTPIALDCAASAQGTLTQTTATVETVKACIGSAVLYQNQYRAAYRSGGFTDTLSDEDTEDDAEARAVAAISAWVGCSNCQTLCSAYRSDRSGTSAFAFGFRKVQTQVSWGATVGQSYRVTVKFARRLLGSGGPFLDLGMQYQVTVTADVVAETTDWIDVPNAAGWETIAASCLVELLH